MWIIGIKYAVEVMSDSGRVSSEVQIEFSGSGWYSPTREGLESG